MQYVASINKHCLLLSLFVTVRFHYACIYALGWHYHDCINILFFVAIDFERLIEENVNNCNGVLRATACAVRELVLNQTCEVPSSC